MPPCRFIYAILRNYSLNSSLIYQYLIAVNTFTGKSFQTSVFDQINLTSKHIRQVHQYPTHFEERDDTVGVIIIDKDVYIA